MESPSSEFFEIQSDDQHSSQFPELPVSLANLELAMLDDSATTLTAHQ
jgi:hypothetical protein